MAESRVITQICVVVKDVEQANKNWSKVLGVPEETIETIFPPNSVVHYTHGKPTEYRDCQVAKYQLDGFVLELIQPGETPSPWRTFLEENGQGVFHFCVLVEDRKGFQNDLAEMGVGLPYHIGYHPDGSYSYVDAKEPLGLELSVNTEGNYREQFEAIVNGTAVPLDELK